MANKNLTRVVYNLLYNHEHLRDDWMQTIRMVHELEMSLYGISYKDYYHALYYTDKLSSLYTIKRLWQLVQERKPDVRGVTWEERQKQGGTYKKDIANFNESQLELFS